MNKIVLISCVSKKRTVKSKASELYISTLFRLSLQYARKLKPDGIFILSAKYVLVDLDDEIEPYDVTLNKMRTNERKVWSAKVIEQIKHKANLEKDFFTILAGAKYRQYLVPYLRHYNAPLEGLSIGKQLQHLKKLLRDK